MSSWQQTQIPYYISGSVSPIGFYPQGAPYPKADDSCPPPPYSKQNVPYFVAPDTTPQNERFSVINNLNFNNKTMRTNFISKVYVILMCQLLITLVLVSMATIHIPTKVYIRSHPDLSIIAIIFTFVTLIALACCDDLRRKSPIDFILLFVFTLVESFLLAVSISHYYPEQVLLTLGLTTVICFALTIFALQTKIDFTVMSGFLLVAVVILFIISLVVIFFPRKIITFIISSAGAIIFSLYLIYDIQLMVGGDHKIYSISPEEYIFAALNIYVDIINIFLYILTIIGTSDSD